VADVRGGEIVPPPGGRGHHPPGPPGPTRPPRVPC